MLRHICAALFLSLFAQSAAASNACSLPPDASQQAQAVLSGVNANRQANGLRPLAYNPVLGRAAMTHACDMAMNGLTGHAGSDGSNSQGRVRAVGYRDCTVAENVAWGFPSGAQVASLWMGSAGHRSNMLHPRVTEMGVGVTNGAKGPNWVLVVARSC
ncbi:Uncharacterized conserved protein YkwD, contains CAP (CSP/antigen 5/PR1) domain [Loktanella fryxellensis]|uniref:Uncharacterized conserved protein YkwD, contains CAP (CSP/antigen 5/PR1) domain n=1 Tax=Loktanella fryxellensis TaxID=245187 RepID=A0A1H8AKB4_9RHOB|nr:CAP domain-containing protein [Loktanella fryxellensis]SEM70434.1 Uncharacterized conserved protein YkwD, contains CAP (CSP/antigen 5/PR1) domain [Loktanella fryxellensis]